MSGLRLEIDLDKVGENARCLVDRAAARGVSITGVTKALLGDVQLANTLIAAGVVALGDSRIENIERMRYAHVNAPMLLIRTPMLSQTDRIVRSNTMSVNTDADVLTSLATAARVCGRVHDVMIMVELGDLRDGVMPHELDTIVRHVLRHPTLRLSGIGTNLACRHGIEPTDDNMAELSALVDDIETTFGLSIPTVSGGNSANLGWLTNTAALGRINNLRLGESILLGRNPLDREPIAGLHTDAFALVGEVIESQRKPTRPWGRSGQNAFGDTDTLRHAEARGEIWQTIVAAGRQDIDPDDIRSPSGTSILAASSDHLIVETPTKIPAGDVLRFEPGYSALLRATTSPYVAKNVHQQGRDRPTIAVSSTPSSHNDTTPHENGHRPRLTIVPRTDSAEPTDSRRVEPAERPRST